MQIFFLSLCFALVRSTLLMIHFPFFSLSLARWYDAIQNYAENLPNSARLFLFTFNWHMISKRRRNELISLRFPSLDKGNDLNFFTSQCPHFHRRIDSFNKLPIISSVSCSIAFAQVKRNEREYESERAKGKKEKLFDFIGDKERKKKKKKNYTHKICFYMIFILTSVKKNFSVHQLEIFGQFLLSHCSCTYEALFFFSLQCVNTSLSLSLCLESEWNLSDQTFSFFLS